MKILYAIAISLFFASGVFADTASVTNTIKTSVSTGGNTSSGSITEGKSEASVKVYTEVDGETVTDFEEKYEDKTGNGISVVKEFNYGQPAPTTSIKVKTEFQAEAYREEVEATSSIVEKDNYSPVRRLFIAIRNLFRNAFSIFR